MSTNIRVLCGNVGPRWSSRAKISVRARKQPLLDAFKAIPGGPPGILILQECVAETQEWLEAGLGYTGYGNGIHKRGPMDRDRSGDNGVILWDPESYKAGSSRVKYVGVGATNTFVRVITLTRIRTGDSVNVAVTHPPNSVVTETFRMHQIRSLARYVKSQGFSLANMVWGADWNSSIVYPNRGVRTMMETEFGLRDIERLLSADDFHGNSINSDNHFKPTRMDGKKIDAILIGSKVRARAGMVYRTDAPPQKNWCADHNWIIGNLTIGA
jgi:hypothetical protein